MKKLAIVLPLLFFAAGFMSVSAAGAAEKPRSYYPHRPQTEAAKKPSAAPLNRNEKIYVSVTRTDVTLYTGGYIYCVEPEAINFAGYIMYFAAKDETTGKDLLVKKMLSAKTIKGSAGMKRVDASFALGRGNSVDPHYRLDLLLEVRKGFPMLAVYSKFFYLGPGVHKCVVNWGLSNGSSSGESAFKYYAVPEGNKILTYRLPPSGGAVKIGYEKWIYPSDGRGSGVGLICPYMLGKGSDFIFINSVPPEKDLSANQSADIFFLMVPLYKNLTIMKSLYSQAFAINWDF